MKKLMLISAIVISVFTSYARPGCQIPQHSRPGPRAHYHHSYHSHYDNRRWIGPTIVGSAILGSTIINAVTLPKTVVILQPVVTQPVVVQQPVVVKQPVQVWIDGHYVDQVQPNGSIIRVWQPGHYEWR